MAEGFPFRRRSSKRRPSGGHVSVMECWRPGGDSQGVRHVERGSMGVGPLNGQPVNLEQESSTVKVDVGGGWGVAAARQKRLVDVLADAGSHARHKCLFTLVRDIKSQAEKQRRRGTEGCGC